MAVVVDGSVTSITYNGSTIKEVRIGADKVWSDVPAPMAVPTNPHFIRDGDWFSTNVGQRVTGFRRTSTPLGADALDISAAKDRSILQKGNEWYSAYPVVYLNENSNNLFYRMSGGPLQFIDFTGISTYFVKTMMNMFMNAGSPTITYGSQFYHNSLTNLDQGGFFTNSTWYMFNGCTSARPNWPDLKFDATYGMFYK